MQFKPKFNSFFLAPRSPKAFSGSLKWVNSCGFGAIGSNLIFSFFDHFVVLGQLYYSSSGWSPCLLTGCLDIFNAFIQYLKISSACLSTRTEQPNLCQIRVPYILPIFFSSVGSSIYCHCDLLWLAERESSRGLIFILK